ncbi:UDP-N-acetylglucosamine 4,6-dehydratase family protein [Shewanella chilikensis]|uniref:UDP-N-acetylglucosamine 4,6-dehydratase family protein n=1 Tax=Shewanella chilikensis TaxID=558541 RepID=UPI00399C1867
MFKNKVLLITGGTGSFGNQVASHFLSTDIKEIRIFSRDEAKQEFMRKKFNSDKLRFYIGDVRDYNSVYNSLNGVDYIFHAAALKQVPSCEFFPIEAVNTNVLGTQNVLNAAINRNVKKVVCLSTDKACYPVNAMGMSKALMEKVFIAKAKEVSEGNTVICGTRYGNVLASRGSVVPLFLQQAKDKQPLTITDPKMTRFVMTLQEAMDLVLFAFQNGKPGDLFIQKSPACTVEELFDAINFMHGNQLTKRIIGTRHGEKDYEVLMTKEESVRSEDLGNYYRIHCDSRNLNYDNYTETADLDVPTAIEYSSNSTHSISGESLVKKLESLNLNL